MNRMITKMEIGVFITIEGPDGAGKTAIQTALAERLQQAGYSFERTREPGGIDIAEQIRHVILNPKNTAMDAHTEALLYAAARRQHLTEKILPTLQSGNNILCDRFVDSSLAYQGHARGLGIDEVFQINQFAIQGTMPDLSLFLMLDPKIGLARISQNRKPDEVNRLDLEKLEFHQKVFEGYQILVNKYPERIKVVNANQEFEKVLEDALQLILKFFKQKGE